MALRHEIGHIIDFLSYDGMDADEYERMNETNVNAEKEFYENLKTNFSSVADKKFFYECKITS